MVLALGVGPDIGKIIPGIKQIVPLPVEASQRRFFRLVFADTSRVAMVYPQPAAAEIHRLVTLTDLFRQRGIAVPAIEKVVEQQIVLQEDLGDDLLQQVFSGWNEIEKARAIERLADILGILCETPAPVGTPTLDAGRMKWEMDFFITHFVDPRAGPQDDLGPLSGELAALVDSIGGDTAFAHRDFHSRNMLWKHNRIYLVDIQDSLTAPVHYDLVSWLFDAYFDFSGYLGRMSTLLAEKGIEIDRRLLYMTALQRTLKALGTFGFQINQRGNLVYRKYIGGTLRHIMANPLAVEMIPECRELLQRRACDR